jgi:hypothetical protein
MRSLGDAQRRRIFKSLGYNFFRLSIRCNSQYKPMALATAWESFE